MSANNDLVHVVFFAGAIWGHARPAVQVSITLCRRSPNLVISLLVPENLVPKAKKAIDLMLAEATSDASLAGDWERMHSEPQELPRPSMLMVDLFTEYEREHIKSINDVPIIFWWSANLDYFVFHFGPDGIGGLGPLFLKALDISNGDEREKEQGELWATTLRDVATVGDLPPIYQYEHMCSRMPTPPGSGFLMNICTSSALKKVDGYMVASGSWIEPEAHKIAKAHFDDTLKKPTYFVNLQISADKDVGSPERIAALSPPEKEILTFLDDALAKHGAESVLYLSWGTNFAPFTAPWQADVFIDVMVEHKRPFVMSEATMGAIMNPGLEERIHKARAAGLCASAAWVPQEAVLKHKALGAFITHGGWNSTSEAIASATPMIFWPFAIDQPLVASMLSDKSEPAGWQLYETRGPTLSDFPLYHFKEGPKTSALGESIPVPTGTPEALRAEFERVLIREAAAGSPELKKRKERMLALRERFIESTRPGAEAHQSISDLLSPIGCTIRA
ncbi:unnamed protein product [Tilletia laevis]|uniref:Glycosyltransferase family 1 protein n=1 Tax=Tilletia laevis TaxID=157183 RepID=A0A9N8M9Y7_9BASI|nr:unnamed protein product [Tilletia laevis]CAD6965652.1 unnamed protein product [Tilletia laevis]